MFKCLKVKGISKTFEFYSCFCLDTWAIFQFLLFCFCLVGVLPKSAHKSGLASISMAKVRRAASPLPSPPEQSAAPVSPVGIGNITKSHEIDEESPVKVKSKENAASAEKNAPNRTNRKVGEVSGGKVNLGCKPVDLPNMLITLLKEHPKGMRLKVSTGISCLFLFL